MKKYLFSQEGTFRKANMHCHTTISDGLKTAEEVKKAYMSRGYSIVAFTDHRYFVPHNDLSDENFLAINSYEIHMYEQKDWNPDVRVVHFNLYAKNPDISEGIGEYDRSISAGSINETIRKANEMGFFVSYNHPEWSLQTLLDYIQYEGFAAFEVYNYGCDCDATSGYDEWNIQGYRALVNQGRRIIPFAVDDNHNGHGIDGEYLCDSFGGFIGVKTKDLKYETVIQAILDGEVYASMGPEFYDLYIEDNAVHITCSPVRSIKMMTSTRRGRQITNADGSCITEAVIPLEDNYRNIQFLITDTQGRKAVTRAYFKDEIFLM